LRKKAKEETKEAKATERAEKAERLGLTKHSFGISYNSNSECPSILRMILRNDPVNAQIHAEKAAEYA
jgi:hypothetical protein